MDDQPITFRRFAFEYGTALLLIVGGFLIAGFLAEFIAPGSQLVYGLSLSAAVFPFLFWLRHCGAWDFDGWDLLGVILLLFAMSFLFELAAPWMQPGNPASIPLLSIGAGLLHWFIHGTIAVARRALVNEEPESTNSAP